MEILRSLTTSERSVAEVLRGLDTVDTLLGNIAASPTDARYRSLRRSNTRIAALLGREEEGLLRAAGFEDAGDDGLACFHDDGVGNNSVFERGSLQRLIEVLDAVRVARAALKEHSNPDGALTEPADCICRDAAVARTLDCALLDFVSQRSADEAESAKRRRKMAEDEAVRSPRRWRDALCREGGHNLCDSGPLEAWLDENADHRGLAYDLLKLQNAAKRWYGSGALQYCEAWRSRLSSQREVHVEADAAAGGTQEQRVSFISTFREELHALREILFEFPERAGATPELFRHSTAGHQSEELPETSISLATDHCQDSGDCSLLEVCPAASETAEGRVTVMLE
mmetsp:Transcript_133845/g.267079  ORF Transcript_133845/g.267079 Transcript_133845/m.267079 type:complete len:342 (-) Transcript_133845:23-1048(-)